MHQTTIAMTPVYLPSTQPGVLSRWWCKTHFKDIFDGVSCSGGSSNTLLITFRMDWKHLSLLEVHQLHPGSQQPQVLHTHEPHVHRQETAHSLWGEGFRVRPTRGVRWRWSSETPGGGQKRKCCSRVLKKMKSSILARPSPRQTLRPVRDSEEKDLCYLQRKEQLKATAHFPHRQKKARKRLV